MQNSIILFIYGSGEEGLLKCFIVELCTVQFLQYIYRLVPGRLESFLVLKVLFDIKVYFTQPVFKMSVLTKYFVYNSSGSDVFLQETCYLRTRQSGPHGRSITVIFLSVYRREYLATPHPPTGRSPKGL